jgi:PhoH-like ATPase
MVKYFVIDSNIFMKSFNALTGFDDNIVVVTATVLEELNKYKDAHNSVGFNSRETLRILKELRRKGKLSDGVKLLNGGTLMTKHGMSNNMPAEYPLTINDNKIIATAMLIQEEHPDNRVIIVTSDVDMMIKCDDIGIEVQEYMNESITYDYTYTGFREASLLGSDIDRLYSNGHVALSDITDKTDLGNLEENEYINISSNDGTNKHALAYHRSGVIYILRDEKLIGYNGIKGRNFKQKMLMHALLAPTSEISLVIVMGTAGTGKTFLAEACGLEKTYTSMGRTYKYQRNGGEYESMIITRTNVQSDNDLGALPGDLEEKMNPLLRPFYDNMKKIFEGKEKDKENAKQQIQYVLGNEIVEIEAVGYLRGASLEDKFLIVDEAQNMTASQALEVVTRAADGTKVVLLGDPDQIDARYLDKHNNGLVFTAERMKGDIGTAQITFAEDDTVRSRLSMAAAARMKTTY